MKLQPFLGVVDPGAFNARHSIDYRVSFNLVLCLFVADLVGKIEAQN